MPVASRSDHGAPDPDLEAAVARNVRHHRLRLRVSQAELAEALGRLGFPMHQTTVAKLEAGERPIRLNEAAALASLFEVPLPQLLSVDEREIVRLDDLRREVARRQTEYERAVAAAERAETAAEAARARVSQSYDAWSEATHRYEQEVDRVQRGEAS